jgi:hypothetical protein
MRASNSSVSARARSSCWRSTTHTTQALRPSPLWVPSITATIGLCERARCAGAGGDAAAVGCWCVELRQSATRVGCSTSNDSSVYGSTRRTVATDTAAFALRTLVPLGTIIGDEVAPSDDMTWAWWLDPVVTAADVHRLPHQQTTNTERTSGNVDAQLKIFIVVCISSKVSPTVGR